jgi:DNA repair protein SbcC/Rad50
MKLVSLSLRQWRTFDRCDLEFPDGLIGIRGQNGAGKTTLAEAIGWALFGKIRPGAKVTGLRRQGAPRGEPSIVELVFRIGPTLYRVERIVGGTARLWIGDSEDPETTQTRATNSRIAMELDLTWDVFHRTVFARQKDVAALDPSGTADSRRRHVERLLGLERYRLAAEKARGDARTISDELTGRRAQAPDLAELQTQLDTAEKEAAEADPAVAGATASCDTARVRHELLVGAVDAEADRAQQHTKIQAERETQKKVAEHAEAEADALRKALGERERKLSRMTEIRADAAGAGEASRLRELWDDLEEAAGDLAAAVTALGQLGYDPEAAGTDATRLAELTSEGADAEKKISSLIAKRQSLDKRLAALDAVSATGSVSERTKELDAARGEHDALREQLGIIRHQLELDRDHVQAVAEGGAETPCPVCLRPYGEEYESILATYRERISEQEREIAELEAREKQLAGRVSEADVALRKSERAVQELDVTEGPTSAKSARSALERVGKDIQSLTGRREEIGTELPRLQDTVARQTKVREKWSIQEGVRADRAARVKRILKELAVDAYETKQHRKVRQEAERLVALAGELDQLAQDLETTGEIEAKLAVAEESARQARENENSAVASLQELAYKPDRLKALRAERDEAQSAYQTASTALSEARSAAQARSEGVRRLRDQVDQARSAHEEIRERALDLERHQVAARLLTEFRTHQSQRAWPHLEQGASALLSAATATCGYPRTTGSSSSIAVRSTSLAGFPAASRTSQTCVCGLRSPNGWHVSAVLRSTSWSSTRSSGVRTMNAGSCCWGNSVPSATASSSSS